MDVRKEIESMYNQIPPESRQQLNSKDLQYFFKMTQILKQYVTDLQIKNTELYQKTAEYKQRLTETEDYCLKQNDVIRQHKMFADVVNRIKILLSLSTSSSEEMLYQKIDAVLDIEQRCKEALYNQLIVIKTEISAVKKMILIQKQNLQTQGEDLNKIIYDWLSQPGSNGKLTIVQCLSVIADLKNVIQHKINQFNQINELNEGQIEKNQETIKKLTFQVAEQEKQLDELRREEPSLLSGPISSAGPSVLHSSQTLKQLESLKVQNNTLQLQRVELLNEINRLQNQNRKLEQSLAISYQVPQKISKDALVNYHTAQAYNKQSETQIQRDINNMLRLNNKVIFTLNAHEQIDKLKAEADGYRLQASVLQKDLNECRAKLSKTREALKSFQNSSAANKYSIIQRGRLENENMKLKKELNESKKLVQKRENELADMSRSASISSKQMRQISSQTLKNASTIKENSQLKAENEVLLNKNQTLLEQLDEISDQVNQQKLQISQLQEQNLQLNQQIILSQSQTKENLSNAAQIIQDKQNLIQEVNTLNNNIISKEQQIKTLQNQNDTLQNQISDFQQQLDETKLQLEQYINGNKTQKQSIKLFQRIIMALSALLSIGLALLIAFGIFNKKAKLRVIQCIESAGIDKKHWENKYNDAQKRVKLLKEQLELQQAKQVSKRQSPFFR